MLQEASSFTYNAKSPLNLEDNFRLVYKDTKRLKGEDSRTGMVPLSSS